MENAVTTKTIKIVPLNKESFSGISSYPKSNFVIGTELGSDGLYKTGLTKEEERKYEIELTLPMGTLNKRSNWWSSGEENIQIRLNRTKATLFTIETPLDELKYKVILQSSKICNSNLERAKYPNAYFIIEDKEADAEVESTAFDYEFEAYDILMKTANKRGLLKVLVSKHGKMGTDTFSDSMVKSELIKEMKKDPKEFIRVAGDPELKTRVLIEDLLEYGIIKKHGNYYKNGDDPIGNSTEEVISYFTDMKNQSIRMSLENKLNKTKTIKSK